MEALRQNWPKVVAAATSARMRAKRHSDKLFGCLPASVLSSGIARDRVDKRFLEAVVPLIP
eukprot:6108337-Amphidinium_carterae.1